MWVPSSIGMWVPSIHPKAWVSANLVPNSEISPSSLNLFWEDASI